MFLFFFMSDMKSELLFLGFSLPAQPKRTPAEETRSSLHLYF